MIRSFIIASLFLAHFCFADDIVLIGTMGNKGVFQINGQKKTLQAGQESGSFKIIAIQGESALIANNGKQQQLQLGQGYVSNASSGNDGGTSVVLTADERGHYMADVFINHGSLKGVIDTGATHLSMSRPAAEQMKIAYKNGQAARTQTANGTIAAWIVKLPQIRLSNVTLYDVPAIVRDSDDNSPILIGTSTLNRFQIKQEQNLMILTKKTY